MFLECIPSISWWIRWVNAPDKTLQLAHSMQKQTSLSQYKIFTANGVQKQSIPTIKSSRKGLFERVEISYAEDWTTDHWRAIESAYLRSPFFIYYNYKIEPVFKKRYHFLFEFNLAMIKVLHDCLKLDKQPEIDTSTEAFYHENNVLAMKGYPQVFDGKFGFIEDLSVLDLLFNLGPESLSYLEAQISIS